MRGCVGAATAWATATAMDACRPPCLRDSGGKDARAAVTELLACRHHAKRRVLELAGAWLPREASFLLQCEPGWTRGGQAGTPPHPHAAAPSLDVPQCWARGYGFLEPRHCARAAHHARRPARLGVVRHAALAVPSQRRLGLSRCLRLHDRHWRRPCCCLLRRGPSPSRPFQVCCLLRRLRGDVIALLCVVCAASPNSLPLRPEALPDLEVGLRGAGRFGAGRCRLSRRFCVLSPLAALPRGSFITATVCVHKLSSSVHKSHVQIRVEIEEFARLRLSSALQAHQEAHRVRRLGRGRALTWLPARCAGAQLPRGALPLPLPQAHRRLLGASVCAGLPGPTACPCTPSRVAIVLPARRGCRASSRVCSRVRPRGAHSAGFLCGLAQRRGTVRRRRIPKWWL